MASPLRGQPRPTPCGWSVVVADSSALVHGCCCFSSLKTWPPPCGDNHGLPLAGGYSAAVDLAPHPFLAPHPRVLAFAHRAACLACKRIAGAAFLDLDSQWRALHLERLAETAFQIALVIVAQAFQRIAVQDDDRRILAALVGIARLGAGQPRLGGRVPFHRPPQHPCTTPR